MRLPGPPPTAEMPASMQVACASSLVAFLHCQNDLHSGTVEAVQKNSSLSPSAVWGETRVKGCSGGRDPWMLGLHGQVCGSRSFPKININRHGQMDSSVSWEES